VQGFFLPIAQLGGTFVKAIKEVDMSALTEIISEEKDIAQARAVQFKHILEKGKVIYIGIGGSGLKKLNDETIAVVFSPSMVAMPIIIGVPRKSILENDDMFWMDLFIEAGNRF